jgi:hypothetical protein
VHTLSARGSGGQLDEFLQKVFGVDRFWHGRVHALCQALLDLFRVLVILRFGVFVNLRDQASPRPSYKSPRPSSESLPTA